MILPEIQTAVSAIAAALDEISHDLPARIAVGADEQAPATRTGLRLAMDTLSARVIQIRPAYIGKATPAEIENFAAFLDSLAVLTRNVERPLDEPPRPPTLHLSQSAISRNTAVSGSTDQVDPALVRYCLKVGLCIVVGYLVGPHYRAPGLINYSGGRNNNRDSHLWRNLAQDAPADHRSDNRRSGFPSHYHCGFA